MLIIPKKITEAKIQSHLQTLAETPQRLALYSQGYDDTRLTTRPAPKQWSPVDILAHLRSCADVWGYSIYAMLIIDAPELTFIHPRQWARMQRYHKLSFAENLLAFDVERQNLLRKLHELKFETWLRTTRFTGKVNTHTLFSQTERMALHEAQHCDQIEALLRAP